MFAEIALTEEPGRPATLVVRGELDLASAAELRAQLEKVAADRPPVLVVDLTETTFVDSSGLGAIAGGLRAQRQHGGSLEVVGCAPHVRRVFEISGLGSLLAPAD